MASTKKQEPANVPELLKDLMIIQLALAGVQQRSIRSIVGCDINRVTRIAKHLKSKKSTGEG